MEKTDRLNKKNTRKHCDIECNLIIQYRFAKNLPLAAVFNSLMDESYNYYIEYRVNKDIKHEQVGSYIYLKKLKGKMVGEEGDLGDKVIKCAQ